MITTDQREQITTQRASRNDTRRVVSPALEELMYEPMAVLDHGFVRVVDYMGNDDAIVQAARVSYGSGTKSVRGDAGLIGYLMRHRHTTPFEMCEIKYHVKLPVFVARQWIRHRTANVNEYSARYSGPGILYPVTREPGCTVIDQRAGQGQTARGRGGAFCPADPEGGCRQGLRRLRAHAERRRACRSPPSRAGA